MQGVHIEDASLDPQNLKRFPVMTAAQFLLTRAPQFQDDEPRILPYIQAFREWRSIDILVHLSGVVASDQPQLFESAAMSVWLYRDQGMMRYHAELGKANSADALPPPQFNQPAQPATIGGATRVEAKPDGASLLPLLLMGIGASLAGGACLYIIAMKRTSRRSSARSAS